jgi:hypothetical protein
MAEPKGGLLAIIGGGKPGDSEKSEKSGASSAKARALESMWSAMKSGDFDEAAEHFQEAYDECAMHSAEADEGDELDLDEEEEV